MRKRGVGAGRVGSGGRLLAAIVVGIVAARVRAGVAVGLAATDRGDARRRAAWPTPATRPRLRGPRTVGLLAVFTAFALALTVTACGGTRSDRPAHQPHWRPVAPAAAALVAKLRDGPFDASSVAVVDGVLKAAGVAVVADESVDPGTASLRMTAWQEQNLTIEAADGGGIDGQDLDDADPTDDGVPPIEFIVAGWAVGYDSPAARFAQALIGDRDWTRADRIAFPRLVLMLFLADASRHPDGSVPAAAQGAKAVGGADIVPAAHAVHQVPVVDHATGTDQRAAPAAGVCSEASRFAQDAIAAVADFLKVKNTGGGLLGFLSSIWNSVVDLAAWLVSGLVRILLKPVVDALVGVFGIVATIATVTSVLTQWNATLTPTPPANVFGVGATGLKGSIRLSVADGNLLTVPAGIAACANLVGVDLARIGSATDAPVTWTRYNGNRPDLTSTDSKDPAVGPDKTADFRYTTGVEQSDQGQPIQGMLYVSAAMKRSDVDKLRDMLVHLATNQLPASIRPVVDEWITPWSTRTTSSLTALVDVKASVMVPITYHGEPPTPSATPTSEPKPSDGPGRPHKAKKPKPSGGTSGGAAGGGTSGGTNGGTSGGDASGGTTPPDTPAAPPDSPCAGASASCGSSNGDPHLTTFNQYRYDFQAAGEFTDAVSPAGDLTIQTRQAPLNGSRTVAVTTAVAAKVGPDRLTFTLDAAGPKVRLNGTPAQLTGLTTALPGGGTLTQRTSTADASQSRYIIRWPDGSQMWVDQIGRYGLRMYAAPSAARKGKLAGLLGNFDGLRQNDLALADGRDTGLGAAPGRPDFQQLYPAFADAWRVTQGSSLFDYAAGQTTDTFTDRGFPSQAATVDTIDPAARASAEDRCRAAGVTDAALLADCALDVASTGEAAFAGSAADTQATLAAAAADPSGPGTPSVHSGALKDGDKVTGTIATPGQRDHYVIDVGPAAEFAITDWTGAGAGGACVQRVGYDLVGVTIAAPPCDGALARYPNTGGGRFDLDVHGVAGRTGRYGFTVVTTKPRDRTATVGGPVSGSLDVRGRVDRYAFDAGGARAVEIAGGRATGAKDACFDVTATLKDAAGNVIVGGRFLCGDGAPDALPDPNGRYVLEVGSNGDLVGGYSFTLAKAG